MHECRSTIDIHCHCGFHFNIDDGCTLHRECAHCDFDTRFAFHSPQ